MVVVVGRGYDCYVLFFRSWGGGTKDPFINFFVSQIMEFTKYTLDSFNYIDIFQMSFATATHRISS